MRQLDKQEWLLVRELIKNPRISDNQISKNTKVPVMTVNRKRKQLEDESILHYYCYVDTSRYGLGIMPARQLYVIKFKIGITKKEFIDKLMSEPEMKTFYTIHELESFVGEKDGQLVYCVIIEGNKNHEIVEIFNGKIVQMMFRIFGNDCINEVYTVRLTTQLRTLHNYLSLLNVEKGKIKHDYPDEYIFVD